MDISAILILGLISALMYYLFFHKNRRDKLLAKFPQPPGLPLIGQLFTFMSAKPEDYLPIMLKWVDEYGSGVLTWGAGDTSVILSDPKHLEKLMTSNTHTLKGFEYDLMRPWLGDGILLSQGQKWTHRRKMFTPSFHFKILEEFLPLMDQESRKMVRILKKKYGDGKEFDFIPYVTRCTLDIICETAMGKSINAQENEKLRFSEAIVEFGEILMERVFKPWYQIDFIFKMSSLYKRQQEVLAVIHGLTNSVIKEKKEQRKASKKTGISQENTENDFGVKKKKAFMDMILDAQEQLGEAQLSDTDIREETDTFMFAGHDTTSTAVGFTMFCLGNHPEILEKVREEIQDVFGDDKDRPVTNEDLTHLKYLENVLKESMRLFPPVPLINRKLQSELQIDDNLIIPENVTVAVLIYKIHHDPKYYPEPKLFRPERWTETQQNKHTYSFIPFSAGPRNCIGQKFAMMEAKCMLANLLRNFKVQSVQKLDEVKLAGELTLRAIDGLKLKMTPL